MKVLEGSLGSTFQSNLPEMSRSHRPRPRTRPCPIFGLWMDLVSPIWPVVSMATSNTSRSDDDDGVILALDVGSSGVRCSAYDCPGFSTVEEQGIDAPGVSRQRSVATSRRFRRSVGFQGRIAWNCSESTCPRNLLDVLDECVDDVLNQLKGRKIRGVGFSTFAMNLVGVNRLGEMVGEDATMSYACHIPEVNTEVEELKRRLGEEKLRELYQKTGAPMHAAYAVAQLRNFYNNSDPEPNKLVYKWQTIASACLSRWTGRKALPISYSEASWTGLLNFRTCHYEPTILELLPPDCIAALPDLADYNGVSMGMINHDDDDRPANILRNGIPDQIPSGETGTKKNPYWGRWPALRGARLFLGLGDGACANIGSKCSTASRIAVTVGTSAAARVCLPFPILPLESNEQKNQTLFVEPGLFCYRIDRSHVLVGGALTDGGSVVEWASQLLNLPTSSTAFEECLKEVERLLHRDYDYSSEQTPPQQKNTLTVAPFLSGERSTGFRSGATMSILGLTRETTPAVFLKGCLEGVTLRINAIVRLIHFIILNCPPGNVATEDGDPVRIICSGNALEMNKLWRHMIADCSGLDVVLDQETQDGTSRGVVKLIQRVLFEDDNSLYEKEPIEVSSSIKPQEKGACYWKTSRELQESFIDAVSPLY